jgi:8-oxo-dGTP pyrophosphatase MutT (NUDIX family)
MTDFEIIRRQLGERLDPLLRLRIEPDRIPQAAVSLILREAGGDAQALIIKRSERPGDHWSGHLALPGGRVDPANDADLMATAARETREEIGVDLIPGQAEHLFLGRLPVISTQNRILPPLEITPFVALAPAQFAMQMNDEVADAFWVSISQLKRDGASTEFRLTFGDIVEKWPAYPSAGGPIWGITERIITNFLSRLD